MDHMAVEAAADGEKMNCFLERHEEYIMRCASKAARRYLTKADDEWSLALIAFTQAVQSYSLEKGSFYSFAELLIRRKLIDHFRGEARHRLEQPLDQAAFSADAGEGGEDYAVRLAVQSQAAEDERQALKLEIEAANALFNAYGFSFYDLSDCSPKSRKTKQACALAVNYLMRSPPLLSQLRDSKRLSIQVLEKSSEIPRKILERHRKYIIAATEILCGDFPYLSEYIKFIRKGADR